MKMTKFRLLAAALFPAMALMFPSPPALAAPGGVTNNSEPTPLILFDQAYFAFEVESPIGGMTDTPIWHEIEQMLDNPYLFVLEPGVAGNYQGYPSYRSTVPRRRSFIYRNGSGEPCAPGSAGCNEVPHTGFLMHPLNYNHGGGEECRLLNINFPGLDWDVPNTQDNFSGPLQDQPGVGDGIPDGFVLLNPSNNDPDLSPACAPCPTGVPVYGWQNVTVTVSAGLGRIEEDEASPDFNSPQAPDDYVCIVSTESLYGIGEGFIVCGGDPGEPNHFGFGVLDDPANPQGYSTPCVPGATENLDGTKNSIVGLQLYDPVRGFINSYDPLTGEGGLRKPSLRKFEVGGTGSNPNYLWNSAAELILRQAEAALEEGVPADPDEAPAFLAPSNENDYVMNRDMATVLGKALFWDMQVGSDGVQACASCHFHAGADDRAKGQLNPNHLGGDLTLQVRGPNQDVIPSDFPFHKLVDDETPGEEANCGFPGLPACSNPNVVRDANDIMSSMGVIYGTFADIPVPGAPGSFGTDASGVPFLQPDLRDSTVDPIPAFQGLRRVEPRNTPTFFGTAMNFDNFWDGRARHDFNGGSVFGPSDPQSHVMVNDGGTLVPTRQIIRFASLASLATGPALSEFEMSFEGRNWAKIAKKLLQSGVVPLANQLVDTADSVLGPWSNQGGSACAAGTTAAGKPGLCISYPELIQQAFYPALWSNIDMHLAGCYTDGNAVVHPNQCADVGVPVAIPVFDSGFVVDSAADPFDRYVLTVANGPAVAADTNQFTQMEANMPLFFGLSVHLWGTILVPDDTPMDRFFDANPDTFAAFGESGEPGLVLHLRNCEGEGATDGSQPCFSEVGDFKRDNATASPELFATIGQTLEGGACAPPPAVCEQVPSHGTRQPGDPDPLLGLDFFLGSNLSLKNPNFRSFRCGECHAGGTLTDHTFGTSHQVSAGDWVAEFVTGTPGTELFPEPLGRGRVISGFLLEGELQENAQDGIERNMADNCAVEPCVDAYGDPMPGGVSGGFPQGQALFDNGMYNIGVRPIAEDVGRGGTDAFGWPLSLAYLALKNLGGVDYTPGGDDPLTGFAQPFGPGGVGFPLPNFDPAIDPTGGGLFEPTAQDQQINPGFAEEPADPQLPPYLAPWASNIPVGDESNIDEVFVGLNTVMREPMLEGFTDSFGPFNPAAVVGEMFNVARGPEMATWPNVNRVNTQGAFKAPPLRNVELTGPYFRTGSKLTLRQELDFYDRGGDFPKMNAAHRDFLIINQDLEDEALGGCLDSGTGGVVTPFPDGTCPAGSEPEFTEAEKETIKVALIDFILQLTDERVAYERAPFDHPELIIPLDGAAPDNTLGRAAMAVDPRYRVVPAVGEGGNPERLQNFLGVASVSDPARVDHYDSRIATGSVSGGTPNVTDALRALQLALGIITPPTANDLLNLDVYPVGSPDGVIDINDALFILQRSVGLIIF